MRVKNEKRELEDAVELFRVFKSELRPALVGVYAGDDCIVAVTTDGRRHGWGQSFELWPVVTIKEGTKPRGCAVPKE